MEAVGDVVLVIEAWTAIEPHLPKNQPGARRMDDRRVISGIVHVLKVGCRWCDCPADYGPSTTIHNRFNRRNRNQPFATTNNDTADVTSSRTPSAA